MISLRPGLRLALCFSALTALAAVPTKGAAQAPAPSAKPAPPVVAPAHPASTPGQTSATPSAAPYAALPVAPHVPTAAEKAIAEGIREGAIRAHVKFLSSDLLEGRAPASRGDRLAQEYIAAQMEAAGLEPAGEKGTYLQPVEIIGIKSRLEKPLTFAGKGGALPLRQLDDSIAVAGLPLAQVDLDEVPVVFVGYGIVAPEFGWDDFKGADVKGKVLLFMNDNPNEPPNAFAGKARLYYGRWSYKYEQAARMGAIGAVIVHTTESAGYGWTVVRNSWDGERFTLEQEPEGAIPFKGWTTEEMSRKLVALGGHDLDALIQSARKRDFRPVPLGVTLSVSIKADVRRTTSANVVGKVAGNGKAGEAIVLTSHHDHLGMKAPAAAATTDAAKTGEDLIYNGAVDNASGVAELLEVARAVATHAAKNGPPARSIYFAAVAGEEQGLLGSFFLAAHPPVPLARLAACLNVDSINVFGKTRDMSVSGLGRTTLDADVLAVAAYQGREVKGDRNPAAGGYYRSDQFSFAKAGVPAIYLGGGSDFVKDPEATRAAAREFGRKHYHQPSDEYHESWDLGGAIDDARLFFHVTLRVANGSTLPQWKPTEEFAAVRKTTLEAAAGAK